MDKSSFTTIFFLFLTWLFTNADIISDCINTMDLLGFNFTNPIIKLLVSDFKNPDLKPDYIWGYLSIFIMLTPGVLITFYSVARRFYQDEKSFDMQFLGKMISYFCLPVTAVLYPLVVLFSSRDLDHHKKHYLHLAAIETFGEAVLQIILQIFIVITRSYFSFLQMISICISFITISKTVIEYDLSEFEFGHYTSTLGKLRYILTILPVYVTSLFFRCSSMGIISAHLRYWSFVPIIGYALIIFIPVLTVRIEANNFLKFKMCVTNLAVISIGENDTVDAKASMKYTLITSFFSYIYFTIWLSCILILMIFRMFPISLPEALRPTEIEVWKCINTVENNDGFFSFEFMQSNFSQSVQTALLNDGIRCESQDVILKTNIQWMVGSVIIVGTVNILLIIATRWAQFKIADTDNPPPEMEKAIEEEVEEEEYDNKIRELIDEDLAQDDYLAHDSGNNLNNNHNKPDFELQELKKSKDGYVTNITVEY